MNKSQKLSLIDSVLQNEPFIKDFLLQYLNCLNDKEYQEFFRQYINSTDGSLTWNKDFYKHKPLIKRVKETLIPTKGKETNDSMS